MSLRGRRENETDDREVAELAALADGSLAPERRAALEAEVGRSPELAQRLDEQQRALELVSAAVSEVEAPASLRARVDQLGRGRGRRMAFPARPLLVGAAAAVAAVAIGLVAFDSTSTESFHVALASTDLMPAARGEATLTKTDSGWRIELDATGLPRLEAGRFYQAWLRIPDGVSVPVGTFNEGQDVTLWAGVSPVDFPMLTVTREQADDDQASSGELVLVATVETDS